MASWFFRLLVVAAAPALAICAEPNHSWDALMQSLQPGKTVVVTRMNSVKVEGKLLALGPDSITVREDGQPLVVRKEDVLRVRIANIRRKHTLIAMGVGAAMGAAAMVLLAAVETSDKGQAVATSDKAQLAALGTIWGVMVGAIGGGVAPIGKPLYEAAKPPKQPAAPASRE
jgi:hypothetical protein